MVSGAIADLLKYLVGKVALHPVGKDGDHLGFWAKVGGYFHGCSKVQAGTGSNREAEFPELACQFEAFLVPDFPFA